MQLGPLGAPEVVVAPHAATVIVSATSTNGAMSAANLTLIFLILVLVWGVMLYFTDAYRASEVYQRLLPGHLSLISAVVVPAAACHFICEADTLAPSKAAAPSAWATRRVCSWLISGCLLGVARHAASQGRRPGAGAGPTAERSGAALVFIGPKGGRLRRSTFRRTRTSCWRA